MVKKVLTYFENNTLQRKILEIVMVLIYATVFCLISFSGWLSYSEISIEDSSYQERFRKSGEVLVIGVTSEDMEYYGIGADEIAARVVEALSGISPSSIVGLDIDVNTIGEKAGRIIEGEALENPNVVLPIKPVFDREPVIDKLDNSTTGIIASGMYSPLKGISYGHTAKIPDINGILRHAVFDITDIEGREYPSMVQVCCSLYCNQRGISLPEIRMSDQNTAIVRLIHDDSIDYQARTILEGKVDNAELSGRIILVGYADNLIDNGYLTLANESKYIHPAVFDANVAENILNERLVLSIPLYIQVLLLGVAILILEQLVVGTGFFVALCATLVYELLIQLVGFLLYGVGWVGYSLPHICNGVLSFVIFVSLTNFIHNYRKTQELAGVFGRYVDINIVESLVKGDHPENRKTGENDGKKEKVAVLFADIRRFTALTEKNDAGKIFNILNDYMSMMAEVINKYGGTVDKFIGDCAMGYWVMKSTEYDPTYRACLAAAEIQRKCWEMQPLSLEKYGMNIELGIGISYGDAIVGSIGSSDRSNYTIIGDTVNVASRLENLAPPGETYISDRAAAILGERASCESVGKNISLKNKEITLEVFALRSISPISIKNRNNEKSISEASGNKKRALCMIITAFVVFSIDFIFCLNTLRDYGMNHTLYYSVGLSIVSAVIMVINIGRAMKEYNDRANRVERSFMTDLLRLSSLAIHLQIFFLWIVCNIFGKELYPSSLPGTDMVYVICPIVFVGIWLFYSEQNKYKASQIFTAVIPVAACIVICGLISMGTGVAAEYAGVFGVIYNGYIILISLLMNVLAGLGLNILHSILIDRSYRRNESTQRQVHRSFMGKWIEKYKDKSPNVQIVNIVANVVVGGLSIRATISSIRAGGIEVYSNPSIIGIIVCLMCVLSIVYNLQVLYDPKVAEYNRWYRYVSFVKMLGTLINFVTILLLAVSGEGLIIFFQPRWCTDWTVFLLCPVICFVMWIMEKNDYRMLICMICSLPYSSILPLSKAAIYSSAANRNYEYEVTNFYGTKEMIVIMVGEVVIGMSLCFLSRICARLFSRNNDDKNKIVLSVCGNRRGISGGNDSNYTYGRHSECYVLRSGDYGLVINAGSGLLNASEKLSGCSEVDILLTSCEFSMVMGFLAVKEICPRAHIRMFSPFNISLIAMKPYWPVNVVKGVYERVRVSRKYRLNNDFSVEFEYSDNSRENCMIRITGLARICYTGKQENGRINLAKWVENSNMLLYGVGDNPLDGCYLAIDSNSSYLVLSGFDPETGDDKLRELEERAGKILSEVALGKEMDDFLVYR